MSCKERKKLICTSRKRRVHVLKLSQVPQAIRMQLLSKIWAPRFRCCLWVDTATGLPSS